MTANKTAAQWTGYTVVPLKGELCFESDTLKFKLGDGVNTYDNLPYAGKAAITLVKVNDTLAYEASQNYQELNLKSGSYITITKGTDNSITIGTTGLGNIVTHSWAEVSTAITNAINALDSSVAASSGSVLTGVTQTNGKLTGKTEVAYKTIAPVQSVGGGTRISASAPDSTGKVTINHTGSDATTTTEAAVDPSDSVVTNVVSDSTGHVTKVKKSPLSNMVKGTGLTADKIVVGDGGNSVKATDKGIETSLTASNTAVPTSQAVINYITDKMQALTGALVYKGTIGSTGATVTALPDTHEVGWVYVVSTAGTYAGQACEVGDTITCVIAGTTANNAHWTIVSGENQVTNSNPTLAMNGSTYTIANVDGTNITLKTPSLNLSTVGGSGKMIQSVSQSNGALSAVAVSAPVNTDNTALTNGTTTVKKSSSTGITVTGGTNKITFSDGTNTFDIPISISVSHPNGIGAVAVTAQSTGVSDVAGTAAATIQAGTSNDTVNLATGNKWVQIQTDASGKKITVGHKVTGVGSSGAVLKKVAYDEAGHITAATNVAASEVTVTTSPANTASSSNDSAMRISVGGVTGAKLTQPIYTDMLKDGNLTLVINGNF